jgi:hypothetical protein
MKFLSVFVALLFAGITSAFCQQVIINGSVGNRPLVWDDFTGTPDPSSPFNAYTYWHIRFKYDRALFKGDTAMIEGLNAELELSPEKSWVKKDFETDYLLMHEQGHFDLGKLCLLEFVKDMHLTTFYRADYRDKIQQLFSDVLNKYKDMSNRYDDETDHASKRRKQKEWTAFIQQELKGLEGENSVDSLTAK